MVFYSELSCSLKNFLMNITTVMYYCQQIIFQQCFLNKKRGGLVKFLVILGYQSGRLVHECFVAHGLYCSRELNFLPIQFYER